MGEEEGEANGILEDEKGLPDRAAIVTRSGLPPPRSSVAVAVVVGPPVADAGAGDVACDGRENRRSALIST